MKKGGRRASERQLESEMPGGSQQSIDAYLKAAGASEHIATCPQTDMQDRMLLQKGSSTILGAARTESNRQCLLPPCKGL